MTTFALIAGAILTVCGAFGAIVELIDGRSLVCPDCYGGTAPDVWQGWVCATCWGDGTVQRSRALLIVFGAALFAGAWLLTLGLVTS